MRMLLTSAGVTNPSIHTALTELLGKPLADCTALVVPTANHVMRGGAAMAWRFVTGNSSTPMTELGWGSLGVLELTALPSVRRDYWVPQLEAADAILVNGGDPSYLSHWMRASGLAELLPTLHDTVYVSLSAGSMVMGPSFAGENYGGSAIDVDDRGLGLVDFAFFPHTDHPDMPENTMAEAGKWATTVGAPTYAVDDRTAVRVVDGEVDVVSEGNWKLLAP